MNDQVRDDGLRGDGIRIDRRGGLQRQRLRAASELGRRGLVDLRVQGGHVVEDREQRWPQLDRDQRDRIARQHHQRGAAVGQEEQEHHEGEDGVDHRLGHVAHDRKSLLRDLCAVDPRGVLRGHGLRAAGGKHHAGRIVDPLAAELPGVVDRVDQRVLADEVGGRSGCCGDLAADVGLRDLAQDGRAGGQRRQ